MRVNFTNKLSIIILMLIGTMSSAWAEAELIPGSSTVKWEITGTTLTISGTGEMPNLTIISDQPWNSERSNIENVIVDNDVTSIGNRAFYDFSSLESITLPSGLESIGYDAFVNCIKLKSIDLPSGLESLGNGAFYGCKELTSIDLPVGLKSIGSSAFVDCIKLESISLPSGMTSIGNYVFYGCSSLESITLPSDLTSISEGIFADCISLESITLPSGLESIGIGAFAGCIKLKSITLPDGVTDIYDYTFMGCIGLESIDLPSGLESIGNSAFAGCIKLKSITLPDGVTNIDHFVFTSCSSLESITLQSVLPPVLGGLVFESTPLSQIIVPNGSVDDYKNDPGWSAYATIINTLYVVDFDTQGGEPVPASQLVLGGEIIPDVPAAPTREGLDFAGWFDDAEGGTQWALDTDPVTDNITLYAQWDATVTYNANGGTLTSPASESVREGATITAAPTNPDHAGCTFAGWFTAATGGTEWEFGAPGTGTEVTESITLYAQWDVTVTYDSNGGDTYTETVTIRKGATITAAPTTDPTYTDHTFAGWFDDDTDGTQWVFDDGTPGSGTPVTESITLYAQWGHTVTYDVQWGTPSTSTQVVLSGKAIASLPAPTRTGYLFGGWYKEAACTNEWIAATTITQDVTLFAKWVATYTVTYNTHGGTAVASRTVTTGTPIAEPISPTRTGYTFNGWYTAATGGTKVDFPLPITADITLHAQWTSNAPTTPTTPTTPPTVSVTSVSLNVTTLSIEQGKAATLSAAILPATATNKSVTWSSSNTAVATVSSSGIVTGVAEGTATITVTTVDGSRTATCAVTVTKSTVSIEQVADNKFTAYPNPTYGMVTVTGVTAGQQIRIFNLTGTHVATHTATADGEMQIDLSALPQGTYILKTATATVKVVRK